MYPSMSRLLQCASIYLTFLLVRTANSTEKEEQDESFTVNVMGEERMFGVSLDANYRTFATPGGKWCANSKERGCALQPINSEALTGTFGITVGGDDPTEVVMKFATIGRNAPNPNYGARIFATDLDGRGGYANLKLLGKELTFVIDLSKVPAGMNAAVYFVQMSRTEGHAGGPLDKSGWKRGVGYCDAQCPKDVRYVKGVGWNDDKKIASCCPEMDILEGNRFVTSITAHPCRTNKLKPCDTRNGHCENPCDTDGADVNLFRRFGPQKAIFKLVNMKKPIRVRTQFHTNRNGALNEIVQVYEQKVHGKWKQKVKHVLNDKNVAQQKKIFKEKNHFHDIGGMRQLGDNMKGGMVLALAIWADQKTNMNWLDSCCAGGIYDCSAHRKFSSAQVWKDAWKILPGMWRGPVDYQPEERAFERKDVQFSFPGIPEWMSFQAPFSCSKGARSWDCDDVEYQFSVKKFAVTKIKNCPPGGCEDEDAAKKHGKQGKHGKHGEHGKHGHKHGKHMRHHDDEEEEYEEGEEGRGHAGAGRKDHQLSSGKSTVFRVAKYAALGIAIFALLCCLGARIMEKRSNPAPAIPARVANKAARRRIDSGKAPTFQVGDRENSPANARSGFGAAWTGPSSPIAPAPMNSPGGNMNRMARTHSGSPLSIPAPAVRSNPGAPVLVRPGGQRPTESPYARSQHANAAQERFGAASPHAGAETAHFGDMSMPPSTSTHEFGTTQNATITGGRVDADLQRAGTSADRERSGRRSKHESREQSSSRSHRSSSRRSARDSGESGKPTGTDATAHRSRRGDKPRDGSSESRRQSKEKRSDESRPHSRERRSKDRSKSRRAEGEDPPSQPSSARRHRDTSSSRQ